MNSSVFVFHSFTLINVASHAEVTNGDRAANGLQPDLTLLLDMPAESAAARIPGPADRMESRGIAYLESVRQAFLRELPHSGPSTAVINADQSPEAVWQEIKQAVDERLGMQR